MSLKHAIENYVKGVSSHREFKDFGFIGAVHVDKIDVKKGVATVYFKAPYGAGGPAQEVHESSKE